MTDADGTLLAAAWRYAEALTEGRYDDRLAHEEAKRDGWPDGDPYAGHLDSVRGDERDEYLPAGAETVPFDADDETEAVWVAGDQQVRIRWNPYSGTGGAYIAEDISRRHPWPALGGKVRWVDAHDLVSWDDPTSSPADQAGVDAAAAEIDSNPDEWVWTGGPLLVDTEAREILNGALRVPALRKLDRYDSGGGGRLGGWEVPVVDVWDLIDRDRYAAGVADGGDRYSAIAAQVDGLPADVLEAIGWED